MSVGTSEARIETLIERANITVGRVDQACGVIAGVKTCGLTSLNGRTYSEEALRNAASMYEGRPVMLGHPPQHNLGQERKHAEKIGTIRGVHFRADGLSWKRGLRLLGQCECR
jgi:hypothetical protein